ncbi:hypothetical protein BS47DRAFT_1364763 [Hydnum rufescens UP504]|uniref:Uncharacterized protein n=1 Tax=Hydnum rufescens UP504 TaxID=1448309 RepID=A0A9P6DPL4_9AGAM|nr:hypothetical protein BS47DRAFT_1364763 [Hydnum rufescens UP504]
MPWTYLQSNTDGTKLSQSCKTQSSIFTVGGNKYPSWHCNNPASNQRMKVYNFAQFSHYVKKDEYQRHQGYNPSHKTMTNAGLKVLHCQAKEPWTEAEWYSKMIIVIITELGCHQSDLNDLRMSQRHEDEPKMSSQRAWTKVLNSPIKWNDSTQELKPGDVDIPATEENKKNELTPEETTNIFDKHELGLHIGSTADTNVTPTGCQSGLWQSVMGVSRVLVIRNLNYEVTQTQPSIITVRKDRPIGDSTQTCKPTTIIGTAKKGNFGYKASSRRSHP